MPKATLEFALPEEQAEFQTASHAGDYKQILWNIDQMLRAHVKHGTEAADVKAAYQDVRDFLHAELVERGIDIV